MPRARVSAAMLKRLTALERWGSGDNRREHVMVVPPILGIDEWEALAIPAQAKLVADAQSDIDRDGASRVDVSTLPEAPRPFYGRSLETGKVRPVTLWKDNPA